MGINISERPFRSSLLGGIFSQVFPPCGSHSSSKHGAFDLHVDLVKRTHDGLEIILVNFGEEALHRLLGLRARWIGADRRRVACRSRRSRVARLMQQEELDVASGHEAGDVAVEELVYDLEIPILLCVSQLSSPISSSMGSGREGLLDHLALGIRWGCCVHLTRGPLNLLDNVQATVQDELVQVPRLLGEASLPVAPLLAGAELILEQRVILSADDGEVVRHDVTGPPSASRMRR